MNLPNRQRLGAAVLIVSGIAAFVAPFLIHSPPTQGNIGPGPDNGNNDNTTPPGGNPGGGGPKKKTLQDLKNAVGDCQTDNDHDGPRTSLMAKVLSAMRAEERAEHQTRTDQVAHHVAVLYHKLDTPSAEKHVGTCASGLKDLIGELTSS